MKYAKSAARGRGLLMAGSSLGILTFLMAAAAPAALMVAPTQALAADECGVQASDGAAITCPAGTYPTGITYSGGTVPVTIDDTAVVSDGGISLTGTTAVSLTTAVNTPDAGDLQVNNTTGAGLALSGGAITVDLTDNDSCDTAGSITGLTGVSANSTGGAVSLNLGNLAITGTDPNGYSVYAVNTGTGGVNLSSSGALTGDLYVSSADGMNVTTGDVTDDVTLDNSGQMWSFSSFNIGSVSGDLNLNGAGSWAFLQGSTGAIGGNATISSTGGYVSANTGNVAGNLTVDSSGQNYASAYAGNVGGDVLVSSSGGSGASASVGDVGGNVTLTSSGSGSSASVSVSGTATNGIVATGDTVGSVSISTSGNVSGGITATADGGGSVSIGANGAVTGDITATGSDGGYINASAYGGVTGNLTGTGHSGTSVSLLSSGAITGDISATTDGGGSASVSASGSAAHVTASTTGGGAVNISAANLTVGGPLVGTSDTGDIALSLSGAVSTGGNLAQLSTGGSVVLNIGSGFTTSQSAFDLTVGNQLTINNSGTFTGPIDFSIAAGGGHFNNSSTWAADAITFTDANDSVVNSGTITTAGSMTYDFMGGTDSFSNSGTVIFGTAPGASTLTLTNLESLTNTGTIVFGGSNSTTSDGETNDRLSAPGAAFTGGGTLLMDVNLGGTGQANCSAAVEADCLNLAGGSTSGTTTIKLNTVGTGVGSLNRIVLVDVAGGTSAAGNFKLSSDQQAGENLFFYRLDYDATAKQHYLSGIAGRSVYEFRQIPTSAQNVWYSSTGTYFERQADLRNQLDTGGGPGVWLRVTRALTDRQDRKLVTHGAENFDFNLDTEQDTVGLIGGVDLLRGGGQGTGYAVGVTAGHLDSKVDFKVSSGATDLKGTSYGVYGTLLSPSYFVDGIIQGNKLDVDQKGVWNTGGFAKGQAKSVGAQAEGGWRFAVNDGEAYIEPLATLSYVSTKFDNFALPGNGGSVSVPDAKSLRGSVGVRISGDADLGAVIVKLSGIGRIWDEFEGDNKTVLNSAGNKLAMTDDFSGQLNEIGVGLSFFSKSHKISGFLSTSVKFKDQYNSSDSSIGLRVQW